MDQSTELVTSISKLRESTDLALLKVKQKLIQVLPDLSFRQKKVLYDELACLQQKQQALTLSLLANHSSSNEVSSC